MNYDRIIKIRLMSFTKDATGGTVPVIISERSRYANIQDRQGSAIVVANQRQVPYDYKITIRYEIGNETPKSALIEYEGKVLRVNSISFDNERFKRQEILRCSYND